MVEKVQKRQESQNEKPTASTDCDEEIYSPGTNPDKPEEEELTEHCPETRVEVRIPSRYNTTPNTLTCTRYNANCPCRKMYRELAQQKKEKEERESVNAPKERNYEKEHGDSVAQIRSKEEEIKSRNTDKYAFLIVHIDSQSCFNFPLV